MNIYRIKTQNDNVIVFHIYYNVYGKIDTQIIYIKKSYKAILRIKSEICSIKTTFY